MTVAGQHVISRVLYSKLQQWFSVINFEKAVGVIMCNGRKCIRVNPPSDVPVFVRYRNFGTIVPATIPALDGARPSTYSVFTTLKTYIRPSLSLFQGFHVTLFWLYDDMRSYNTSSVINYHHFPVSAIRFPFHIHFLILFVWRAV